jgi:hypothetical protein
VQPGSDEARQITTCPGKAFTHYDACGTSRLADGSVVMVLQGYEYPDRRVDTKWWSAELVTPQGQHVSVNEWNAAAEKDSPITRPQPPLSAAQLRKVAASKVWRDAIDAMPVNSNSPTTPSSSGASTGAAVSVTSTLRTLVPKGLAVSEAGDPGDTGFGYLVVDDGKGKTLVQVNVQADMADVEGELFGSDAEVLADGTKVATHQGPGEKGGTGVVMWTVDTMRTDGRRVVDQRLQLRLPGHRRDPQDPGPDHQAAPGDRPQPEVAVIRPVTFDALDLTMPTHQHRRHTGMRHLTRHLTRTPHPHAVPHARRTETPPNSSKEISCDSGYAAQAPEAADAPPRSPP